MIYGEVFITHGNTVHMIHKSLTQLARTEYYSVFYNIVNSCKRSLSLAIYKFGKIEHSVTFCVSLRSQKNTQCSTTPYLSTNLYLYVSHLFLQGDIELFLSLHSFLACSNPLILFSHLSLTSLALCSPLLISHILHIVPQTTKKKCKHLHQMILFAIASHSDGETAATGSRCEQ